MITAEVSGPVMAAFRVFKAASWPTLFLQAGEIVL